MDPPTTEVGSPLRISLLGHASGRRADGLSSYSEQVALGLQRRGCSVFLHHARADGAVVPVPPSQVSAWPTWRFKTVSMPTPGFRSRMRARLAWERPHVTHCSLSFTLDDGWVGGLARELGSATVATFHLPFGAEHSGRGLVMREVHRFWLRRLSHYQRLILFSEPHRQRLIRLGVDPQRVVVVPNAVDTKVFSPGASDTRAERLASGAPVVGYLGRLDPEKGITTLLAGFRDSDLGEGARLVIAGAGSQVGEVRRAAALDQRIVYLGQLVGAESRADFWRASDVFCLPSSAEGLSISLLEAMASGCAVLTTPEGGLAAAGAGALPLDPGQLQQSVAAQLSRLAADPELIESTARRARERAVDRHGMPAMIDHLLSIYRECMGEMTAPLSRA